jgi:hypothetical protein
LIRIHPDRIVSWGIDQLLLSPDSEAFLP